MFEHLNTPQELFSYKLGSALTMEQDSLEMLGTLEETTTRQELKELFRAHAEETRHQISNLEQCFKLLGENVNESPSPTTKGLAKEGKSTAAKTDESIVDVVLVSGGLETERYEMAVYETLMTAAKASGAAEIGALLKENYDQEVAASDKLIAAGERIASTTIGSAA
ncbi:MAG TPA: ferritin-like domain-containing protein [Galbitalea sp.]|jgi:ferritin-like metal-binding protein YciE